jgi:hypothetical protein
MISDKQMYAAKKFLNSYADAVDCLRQTARKENSLKFYEKWHGIIKASIENNEISVSNDEVASGRNFNSSYFKKAHNFSQDLYSKYFANAGRSFAEFESAVDSAIRDLKTA